MNQGSDAQGKRILLIFPPMREHICGHRWRATESPTAPLGLMYLATPLIKAGYQVRFIDFTVDRLNQEDYYEALKNPNFILISCYSQAFYNIRKIIHDARSVNKGAIVICGGPHCNETETHMEGSDLTVYGEADHVIAPILARLLSSGSLDDIPGISYNQDGQVIRNPGFHIIEDLDAIEFPSFCLARNKKYGYLYGVKLDHTAGIMTSRGCPFQCTFCTFRRTKYRERAVDRVIREMKCRIAEGARCIAFLDDNFLLRRDRTIELMDEIIRNKFSIKIAIQGRVDLADYDLYKKFKEAGVIIMMFGVESANQDVLNFYQKKTTVEEAKRAINLAHQFGMLSFGNIMIGAPLENGRHFEKNRKFLKEVPLDLVSVHILDYRRGSRLWDDAYKKGLISENEILVAADKRLSNFSTEDLARVQKELTRSFYNNPKRILRLSRKLIKIMGVRFVFKLIRMFFRGTIYRSANTFHGAVAKNVRV